MAGTFELRPFGFIAAAYVLAPMAGLTTLWLTIAVPGAPHLERALAMWPPLLVCGGLICLLIEGVVVTPLLLGYNWRWLNGWTAVALGFVVGDLASAAIAVTTLSNGVYLWGAHHQVLIANGAWTAAAWQTWAAGFAPQFGLGGAVTALVLRLMAVRAVPAAPRA